MEITNFDELKKRHERARVAKVGDKEWIDFATTMIDSFPAIYEKAKKMNAHFEALNDSLDRLTRFEKLIAAIKANEIEIFIETGKSSLPVNIRRDIQEILLPTGD